MRMLSFTSIFKYIGNTGLQLLLLLYFLLLYFIALVAWQRVDFPDLKMKFMIFVNHENGKLVFGILFNSNE